MFRHCVVGEDGLGARARLACGGAFTRRRGVSMLLNFRARSCGCSCACAGNGACPSCLPRVAGTNISENTDGVGDCQVASCLKHLGCSCTNGCCMDNDFHHSNDSHLSESDH